MSIQVAGYTELRELGAGASGRVVVARYDATGQLVAVKHLAGALAANARFRAYFRREAEILGSLRHPNVVALFGYLETPTDAAILMELVDGVALEKILEGGPIVPEAALVVLSGALQGLEAAHRAGVVHRDVKPANILVETAGGSHLADFGVAVASGERDVPAGTPVYMAPEQWQGGPAAPSSDVYAATAVYYQCVTGHPPFRGDTVEGLRMQHLVAQPDVTGLPEPIAALVLHGMAKNPSHRPPTAGVFADELERAAAAVHGPDWRQRGLLALGGAAALFGAAFPAALISAQAAGASTAGAAGGAQAGQAAANIGASMAQSSQAASAGVAAGGIGAHAGIIAAGIAAVAVAGAAVGVGAAAKLGPFATSTPATSQGTTSSATNASGSSGAGSSATTIGRNLVVNGNADAGQGSTDGGAVASIPGWTTTGRFTVNRWDIAESAYPRASDPGPADRGANYFAGGLDSPKSSATQIIDLAPFNGLIARGATYQASAWLGGYATQADAMTLVVSFEDASGTSLARATVGPVTLDQRQNLTGLIFQSTTGTVPKGAVRAVVTMTAIGVAGAYNDGYADDVSLEILGA